MLPINKVQLERLTNKIKNFISRNTQASKKVAALFEYLDRSDNSASALNTLEKQIDFIDNVFNLCQKALLEIPELTSVTNIDLINLKELLLTIKNNKEQPRPVSLLTAEEFSKSAESFKKRLEAGGFAYDYFSRRIPDSIGFQLNKYSFAPKFLDYVISTSNDSVLKVASSQTAAAARSNDAGFAERPYVAASEMIAPPSGIALTPEEGSKDSHLKAQQPTQVPSGIITSGQLHVEDKEAKYPGSATGAGLLAQNPIRSASGGLNAPNPGLSGALDANEPRVPESTGGSEGAVRRTASGGLTLEAAGPNSAPSGALDAKEPRAPESTGGSEGAVRRIASGGLTLEAAGPNSAPSGAFNTGESRISEPASRSDRLSESKTPLIDDKFHIAISDFSFENLNKAFQSIFEFLAQFNKERKQAGKKTIDEFKFFRPDFLHEQFQEQPGKFCTIYTVGLTTEELVRMIDGLANYLAQKEIIPGALATDKPNPIGNNDIYIGNSYITYSTRGMEENRNFYNSDAPEKIERAEILRQKGEKVLIQKFNSDFGSQLNGIAHALTLLATDQKSESPRLFSEKNAGNEKIVAGLKACGVNPAVIRDPDLSTEDKELYLIGKIRNYKPPQLDAGSKCVIQ